MELKQTDTRIHLINHLTSNQKVHLTLSVYEFAVAGILVSNGQKIEPFPLESSSALSWQTAFARSTNQLTELQKWQRSDGVRANNRYIDRAIYSLEIAEINILTDLQLCDTKQEILKANNEKIYFNTIKVLQWRISKKKNFIFIYKILL